MHKLRDGSTGDTDKELYQLRLDNRYKGSAAADGTICRLMRRRELIQRPLQDHADRMTINDLESLQAGSLPHSDHLAR